MGSTYNPMNVATYRRKLDSTQRKAVLEVASAYRTTSLQALQVITGTIPIHIQVKERAKLHTRQDLRGAKKIKRQQEWSNTTEKAQCTKTIVGDVVRWY